MHAVIRSYSGAGAKELFDLLEKRKTEVESVIGTVIGLVSYTLIRTHDGGTAVTICQDKTGTDESLKVAANWIKENAPDLGASLREVSEGPVIIHKN